MPSSGTQTDKPLAAGRRGGGGPLERVTVNLNARASQALEKVAKQSGERRTDVVNRALIAYALLWELQDTGGSVYVREAGADEPERIRLL